MNKIKRPKNLSDGAWTIMQAVYEHYDDDDSFENIPNYDPKTFNDFLQFNFPFEDLYKYCEELHNAGFVFFESRDTDKRFLYMLPKILHYIVN